MQRICIKKKQFFKIIIFQIMWNVDPIEHSRKLINYMTTHQHSCHIYDIYTNYPYIGDSNLDQSQSATS